MKLTEAQQQSPCGVAVYGNVVMRDVVWPLNVQEPYLWVGRGYVRFTNPVKIEFYRNSDLWEPIEEPDWVMKIKSMEGLSQ